jgi:Zn-dependent peptidase ImmA (M78 family)
VLGELRIATPPVDVVAIAEAYGIQVRGADHAQWDGAIDMGGAGQPPTIYVAGVKRTPGQRFAIAHELGHYFLHGHLQRAFRDKFGAQGFDPLEMEANRFALELLMPASWVQTYAQYENASQLAQRFGVAPETMRKRLDALGLERLAVG